MIRYLLDTCVISDFVKGEAGTLAKIQQALPAEIAISSLTVMELRYGLALNPQQAQKIEPLITDFIDSVITLPFTNSEANQVAQIRFPISKLRIGGGLFHGSEPLKSTQFSTIFGDH